MNYILDDDDRALIGRRLVTAAVTGRDTAGALLPEGAVLLAARLGDAPAPAAVATRPGVLVLRRVDDDDEVVLQVRPGAGIHFPEGTVLHLDLRTTRTADADEEVVVLRDVDVSGLGARDLVAVAAHDADRLRVTARGTVPNPRLGPLAGLARAAARHRLGVERTAEAVDLTVAVDLSASMAPVIGDGSVAAVVDVVVGLAQVVGFGRSLGVRLLGERPVDVEPVAPTALAAVTTTAISRAGLGCGFRSVPDGVLDSPGSVTYVVTDGVPADVAALRAAHRRGERRHLVIVTPARLPPAAADLGATVVAPPPPGTDAAAHLVRAPRELADLVASLLAAVPR
jgi:hypothetical protein